MNRILFRWGARTICYAALATSTLSAADIDVTTANDSGAGSFRQGLSVAHAADALVFQTSLNGLTLVTGAPLTVTTPVTLHDATPINVIDPHNITLGAALTVNWTGTLGLNGILSDANTGATGSLINNGTGTLRLSGVNTFTGGTTLNGGTISLFNSSALGKGALTVTNTSGTPILDLANGLTVANAIKLQSMLTVNSLMGTSNTLSGVISGSGASDGLTTTGSGTLILSGANTFAGGVFVTNDSAIQVQNNSSLGTGTLTTTGVLTLGLSDKLKLTNDILLGKNFTADVTTGTATLSGAITETATSQFTKTGGGTLILTGANSYTGQTNVSVGTLQGDTNSLPGNIVNDASLIFNQTTNGTYASVISGTGNFTKNGAGTLTLTGSNSLTGTTTVNTGGLQVDGSLTGPVNVAGSTALLSGAGAIGSVTNSGRVQPGTSSIGTLQVNGNYTQTTGTTEIKFKSTGNVSGTDNDFLNITGKANLGGTLKVLGVSGGTYTAGTQYTILNAAGGVSGQFAQARTDLSLFRVNVTYDANDVKFQLQQTTSLHAAGITSNQASVGAALDNIALASSGDLFNMINDLGVLPPDQQRQALDQLSGQMFGNLQNLGLEIGDQFQQRVTSALVSNGKFLVGDQGGDPSGSSGVRGQSPAYGYDETMPYGSSRGWFQGYGFGGSFRSDGNGAGMNFGQGGGIYAVELGEDETGRIGVVGGNTYGGFSDGFNGAGTISSYQLGMYALKHDDVAYVLGSANYGFNQYYTHRTVSIGTADQSLKADYEGSQIGANVETGLKISAGIFHIQPLIGLQYLYLCQQGFDETGGAAELTVARSRANSLRASIGARVLTNQLVGPGGSVWTPYSHVRLVSDLLDNDRIINASFSGSPAGGAFTSHGTRIGQNYGVIGEGMEIRLNDSWSLFGGGELTFGDRIVVGTGSVGALAMW